MERVRRDINQKLPETIWVFGIKFVTKHFVAKDSASSWRYEYLLPSKLLWTEKNKENSDEQILEQLNAFLKEFEGTHNFHNYT
jgi:tRNA pseudouridine(38-40) synthase